MQRLIGKLMESEGETIQLDYVSEDGNIFMNRVTIDDVDITENTVVIYGNDGSKFTIANSDFICDEISGEYSTYTEHGTMYITFPG